jgi:hypothetical protein
MCGIIGFKHVGPIVNPAMSRRFIEALLRWSKIRGLHATGISWTHGDSLQTLKRSLPADEFMQLPEWDAIWEKTPKAGILHTRYSTSGSADIEKNNQPLALSQLALVHNGLVSMATKEEFERQYGVRCTTENDSEIVLRKVSQHYAKGKLMHEAVQDGMKEIYDVHPPIFACGLLDGEGELFCFRDHIRPMYLWNIPSINLLGFCSTLDIFKRAVENSGAPEDARLFATKTYSVYFTDPEAACWHLSPLHFDHPDDHKFKRPEGLMSGVDKTLLHNEIVLSDSSLDYPSNPARDFRTPKDRREGFIQYYAAEMLTDIDPAFPTMNEIFDRFELSLEQQYYAAFLYAVFYENASVFLVQQEFPELEKIDMGRLERWHQKNWRLLQYQTDRRWNRGHFVEMVASYKKLIGNQTQHQFFQKLIVGGSDWTSRVRSFRNVWDSLMQVHKMGRHSVYAWTETLIRCLGLPMECDSFFMAEAESSRNGLCYALCREDLVTHHDKKPDGKRISAGEIKWLEAELETLMLELLTRWPKLPVDYMFVETVACSYKGLFRSRRYLGYYLDRMNMEIHRGQNKMATISKGIDWQTLWQIRSEIFMAEYLGESQAVDSWSGIRKELCDVFMNTGSLINFGPLVKRGIVDLDACLSPSRTP